MIRYPGPAYYISPTYTIDNTLVPGTVFLGYRGSLAHGMYVPQSEPDSIDDIDLLGVFVGPKEHYLGFGRKQTIEHTQEVGWENPVLYDIVSYEWVKFVHLAVKNNPNVLGMLWLPREKSLILSNMWVKLTQNRQLFASKLAYKTFGGYAKSQLQKMTRTKFQGYMGQKRRELVRRYGYDTKNAAHLIRILRMGIEVLEDGEVYLDRSQAPVYDAEELLEIKQGVYTLGAVQRSANMLFAKLDQVYEKSALPAEPPYEQVERKCVQFLEEYFEDEARVWDADRIARLTEQRQQQGYKTP